MTEEGGRTNVEPIRPPFPFVVGCAKSGTTMLRAMLDSHPSLAVPPESYFVATLARRPRRFAPWDADARARLLAMLASDRWFRGWRLPPGTAEAALERDAPTDLAGALRSLYGAYARSKGKPRHGDKTPAYVFAMVPIATLLPEARFVHLIRDGRDVALSLPGRGFAPSDVASASLFWRQRVMAGRRAGRRLGPERYLEVRYEDLVEEPEERLRAICAFVGLDFDPAMLRYHDRSAEVLAGVPRPGQHANIARPPVRGLRDWRTQMTEEDVMLVQLLTGDLLTSLGYEAGPSRPPARLRMAAARLRVAYELRSASGAARELVGV